LLLLLLGGVAKSVTDAGCGVRCAPLRHPARKHTGPSPLLGPAQSKAKE